MGSKGDNTESNVPAMRPIEERIEELIALHPAKRRNFIRHYLVHRNATEAYRQCYNIKPEYAPIESCRLMKRPDIQEIVRLDEERTAKSLNITHDDIAKRWWMIATADVSELVSVHRPPCRYCHGIDGLYQWRTQRELNEAIEMHIAKATKDMDDAHAQDYREKITTGSIVDPLMPNDEGGFGYTHNKPPNPDCPECDGNGGEPSMQIADVDNLSPQARMVFDGTKQTQHGTEIQFQDRAKALENLAKHTGMFRDQDAQDAINPIMQFFAQSMKNAQTVPVVPDEKLPARKKAHAPAPQHEAGPDDVEP